MLNRTNVMGRLTADPELKQTANGTSVCQFTVAVQRDYSAENEERKADFFNVVAWRSTAEFISKYFTKGKMIIIDGSLRSRAYTDKKDVKHYITEILAENVYFGDSKKDDSSDAESEFDREIADAEIPMP